MPIRKRYVKSIARELLNQYEVSDPPVPVERIAKAEGVSLVLKDLEGDISGFLLRRDDGSPVIGVNSHHPRVRQRFTVAHELGHYLLGDEDSLHIDRKFELKLRSNLSSQGVDSDEIEANLFAAELLMPGFLLNQDIEDAQPFDISDESEIRRLAKKYGVSSQALMIRISSLY
jgi:Zn-dependent peptidase ImmA (M78 family)